MASKIYDFHFNFIIIYLTIFIHSTVLNIVTDIKTFIRQALILTEKNLKGKHVSAAK